jgi:hypothetical protein
VHPVDVTDLKRLFAAGNDSKTLLPQAQLYVRLFNGNQGGGTSGVKLVFVGACYSHNAGQELVKAGVPHVVATHVDSKIDDLAARRFTRAFYLGTNHSYTVMNSVMY